MSHVRIKKKFLVIHFVMLSLTSFYFVYPISAYEAIKLDTYQFKLEQGFNFISIPLILDGARVRSLFPEEVFKEIRYYNSTIQDYVDIRVNGSWIGEDFFIEVSDVFEIYAGYKYNFSIQGVKPNFPFPIIIDIRSEEEIVFFGIPGIENIPFVNVSTYNLNISYFSEWDIENQKWVEVYPEYLNSFIFKPGKGYGIRANEPGVIVFFENTSILEHARLKQEFILLKEEYLSLDKNFKEIQEDYNELKDSYKNLVTYWVNIQDRYDVVLSEYEFLFNNYQSINNNFQIMHENFLELEYKYNDAKKYQNYTYILTITTIFFIGMTIYVMKKNSAS